MKNNIGKITLFALITAVSFTAVVPEAEARRRKFRDKFRNIVKPISNAFPPLFSDIADGLSEAGQAVGQGVVLAGQAIGQVTNNSYNTVVEWHQDRLETDKHCERKYDACVATYSIYLDWLSLSYSCLSSTCKDWYGPAPVEPETTFSSNFRSANQKKSKKSNKYTATYSFSAPGYSYLSSRRQPARFSFSRWR